RTRTLRAWSLVPPWAEPQSPRAGPTGAVQTWSTLLCGGIHARLVPLGEIRGLMRSGFPKRTRLGISSAMRHAYHAGQGDQYYPRRDPSHVKRTRVIARPGPATR